MKIELPPFSGVLYEITDGIKGNEKETAKETKKESAKGTKPVNKKG